MKLDKISIDGKKDSIEVLDKIFSAKINNKLVSSVLYKTNANYKGRHAKTKQQNEVRGPTSKIYAIDTYEGSSEHISLKIPRDFSSIFKENLKFFIGLYSNIPTKSDTLSPKFEFAGKSLFSSNLKLFANPNFIFSSELDFSIIECS